MKSYSWKKVLEAYEIEVDEGFLLIASGKMDKEEGIGLGIDCKDGSSISVQFNYSNETLTKTDNTKKLLLYRGLIIDAEIIPEQMKKGLVKLLEKIEAE